MKHTACMFQTDCMTQRRGAGAEYGGNELMAMPLHLTVKLGTYLMKQKIRRVEKYPLIMELEPLFACNLKCGGCGKIQHPASVLKQRMPVEQAVRPVAEGRPPMVSLAGRAPP